VSVSIFIRLALIGIFLVSLEMLVMEPMQVELMGEAEVDGFSVESGGMNICELSPSSDTWSFAVLGCA
jgi:hypothetical protein